MKTQLTTQAFTHAATQAAVAATAIITVLSMTFFVAEPGISHAVDSSAFRIRQTIVDETSFTTQPSNVTMQGGGINGLTGGTATGTTPFVVRSNNASGYTVTIAFENNAGAHAMLGDESDSEAIRDYSGDDGADPSYNFTASTAAQFAYAVYASTSADASDNFLNNGTNDCNSNEGTRTIGKCWKAPSTGAYQIISRETSASNGATSTIYFKVHVPSGANPIPSAETYTATATLTLLIQ